MRRRGGGGGRLRRRRENLVAGFGRFVLAPADLFAAFRFLFCRLSLYPRLFASACIGRRL